MSAPPALHAVHALHALHALCATMLHLNLESQRHSEGFTLWLHMHVLCVISLLYSSAPVLCLQRTVQVNYVALCMRPVANINSQLRCPLELCMLPTDCTVGGGAPWDLGASQLAT